VAGDARRIEDRAADCSEALLAVADVLGGQWPDMARNAGEAMVEDARTAASPFLRVRLLGDLALVFGDHLGLWTAEILTGLHALEGPLALPRGRRAGPVATGQHAA
jgi:hypothetical protein